jgi:hypothetical protein
MNKEFNEWEEPWITIESGYPTLEHLDHVLYNAQPDDMFYSYDDGVDNDVQGEDAEESRAGEDSNAATNEEAVRKMMREGWRRLPRKTRRGSRGFLIWRSDSVLRARYF